MAALDFPANPNVGDLYDGVGVIYEWTGTHWKSNGTHGASCTIGAIVAWGSENVPPGWLECDGKAIPVVYQRLIALIGNNTPDLRGEFVRGWDHGRGIDPGRGIKSHQGSQNQSHAHSANGNTSWASLSGHFKPGTNSGSASGVFSDAGNVGHQEGHDRFNGIQYNFDASHSHHIGFTTSSNGGSESRPRNVSLMYIINADGTTSIGPDDRYVLKTGDTMTGDLICDTTGALTIPDGTDAQRPSAPEVGALRHSTASNHPEVYTGSGGWKTIAYLGSPETLPSNKSLSGNVTTDSLYYVNNLTISNNSTLTPQGGYTEFRCMGDVTIGSGVKFEFSEKGASNVGGNILSTQEVAGVNGVGLSPGLTSINAKSPIAPITSLTGSSGASGKKTLTGNSDGTFLSGRSGGTIYIHAQGSITIGGNCVFNAKGQRANTSGVAAASGGGSGGGSGGFIVIQADENLTVPGTCKFNADGGNGGNGLKVDWGEVAKGGGGGGGGYIILGAKNGNYNVDNGATFSAKGGIKGNIDGDDTSSSGPRGGSGASCGGAGGHLGLINYSGVNGQDGQILKDYLISP